MSTIVYQDLQSCFESHIIETTTLKLKVPTPTLLENITNEKCWSSLRSLSTNSNLNSKEKENSYVHPLSKRPSSSSSRLSEKSLALCTENLGSETGTDESRFFSFSSNESKTEQLPLSIRIESNYNKTRSCRKLPPPLTTLRGSNSLQVRINREGGRLVIKAVEAPKANTYFQAERSNGRLKLCFLSDGSSASKFGLIKTTDEENGELEDENMFEGDINDEEENGMYTKRDMDGNNYDVEVEIGLGRVRRCKEGRKKYCDWMKPLWVATS